MREYRWGKEKIKEQKEKYNEELTADENFTFQNDGENDGEKKYIG